MKPEKLKSRTKFALKVVWIVFIGVVVSLGIDQLISAWGFLDDGWLLGVGGLVAIYVMVVVWNTDHKKVFNL